MEALGDGPSGLGGWDAEEMFRMNQEKYGVTTNYDDDLPQYT